MFCLNAHALVAQRNGRLAFGSIDIWRFRASSVAAPNLSTWAAIGVRQEELGDASSLIRTT